VPAKESMEELVPDLITFLLTHPDIKSLKQVSNNYTFLLCQPHSCPMNSPCLCKLGFSMKYVNVTPTAPAIISDHLTCQQVPCI